MANFQQEGQIIDGRWDQVSDPFYLDPYGYVQIVAENIATLGFPVLFSGGELIDIPEEPTTPVTVNLPPWKR